MEVFGFCSPDLFVLAASIFFSPEQNVCGGTTTLGVVVYRRHLKRRPMGGYQAIPDVISVPDV